MKRMHSMPFGAEVGERGTRFRLWAPACQEVTPGRTLAMRAVGEGFHELHVPDAPAGSAYGFRLPDGTVVPDPASRFNPEDVNGPSVVVDPRAFEWSDDGWRGRPWNEAVVYEM